METCPFCDRAFDSLVLLCNHLLDAHQGVKVNGTMLRCGRRGPTVRCWCRNYFRHHLIHHGPAFKDWTEGTLWTKHLQRHGGVHAHILKLTLLDKKENKS